MMRRPLPHLVAALLLGSLATRDANASGCPQRPPPPPTQDYQGFKGRVFQLSGVTMPYRLFVPANYDKAKAYPLVLYLHHAGLSGDSTTNETGLDNCVQLTEEAGSGGYGGVFVHSATAANMTKFVTQDKYPHFLLAPHATNPNYGFGGGVEGSATAAEHPTRPVLYGILDQVRSEYNIDPRRIYVTGISMGCYGTWDIIMRKPAYFAAASPQSCRGDPNQQLLSKLVDSPIWSMCGTADSYFMGAQAMADAMQAVGAHEFVFTPFQGVGHSIHNLGYDYPGFIDWMFAQSLPAVADAGSDAPTAGDAESSPAVPEASSAGGGGGGPPMVGTPEASAPVQGAGGGSSTDATPPGAAPEATNEAGCSCTLRGRANPGAMQLAPLLVSLFLYRRRKTSPRP
jgi:dienelactone hydrolase